MPVSNYRVAPPRKVSPANNLPAKICPARRLPEQDEFLPVNCRPEKTFLGDENDLIMERLFMGAGDILIRGDILIS